MELRREMERRSTMLVFVPQSYIALVYAGGELRAVVEAGVGFVPHSQGLVQEKGSGPFFRHVE
jgi:hypothetical protein